MLLQVEPLRDTKLLAYITIIRHVTSLIIILTKFHHLKTSNNENNEIPETLTWSVTKERMDGRMDVQTENYMPPYFVGGA
jgi:hypothetical protein